MGEIQQAANDEAPDKASEWLVALTEAPDNSDLWQRFEAWLTASPAHAIDWAEMTRTYKVLGLTMPVYRQNREDHSASDMPSTALLREPRHPLKDERLRLRRWRRSITALAGLAAAACFLLFFGPGLALRLEADHLTGTGEQQIVRLSDGSTVYLGPRSAISVLYSANRRQINLLQGEAFFDVVHDAGRPFSVGAQNTTTTDIGTAFDIRLNNHDTDISVKQGLVQLDTFQAQGAVSAKLKAGDWARVNSSGQMELGVVAPDDIASWMNGQLIVKNQPAKDVIDQLRPYYHGMILIQGDDLASRPLTGVYNLADPISALRAVVRAQGAVLHQLSPWVLVISAP